MQPFWIIWNPQGVTPPKREYKSEAKANVHARQMAERHDGQVFHVMRGERAFQKQIRVEQFATGCENWTRQ